MKHYIPKRKLPQVKVDLPRVPGAGAVRRPRGVQTRPDGTFLTRTITALAA